MAVNKAAYKMPALKKEAKAWKSPQKPWIFKSFKIRTGGNHGPCPSTFKTIQMKLCKDAGEAGLGNCYTCDALGRQVTFKIFAIKMFTFFSGRTAHFTICFHFLWRDIS